MWKLKKIYRIFLKKIQTRSFWRDYWRDNKYDKWAVVGNYYHHSCTALYVILSTSTPQEITFCVKLTNRDSPVLQQWIGTSFYGPSFCAARQRPLLTSPRRNLRPVLMRPQWPTPQPVRVPRQICTGIEHRYCPNPHNRSSFIDLPPGRFTPQYTTRIVRICDQDGFFCQVSAFVTFLPGEGEIWMSSTQR